MIKFKFKKIDKKQIIKIVIPVLSIILVVAFLFGLTKVSSTIEQLRGFRPLKSYTNIEEEIAAENSSLAILWDSEAKQIYLYDKKTDTKWGPRMVESSLDGEIIEKKLAKVFSPIFISYYNVDNFVITENVMASSASIDEEAVASRKIDNGIMVRYDFPKEKISVSVEYTLEDDHMVASVDKSLITESDEFFIVSVSMAPYMCSVSDKDEDAYVFVPSGSGALVYPQVTGSKILTTVEKIYGDDAATKELFDFNDTETVALPVYGAKIGNKGLCAIVTDDAETSEIVSVSQDKTTNMATVYASSYVRGHDIIDMPEGFGSGGTTKLMSNPKSDSVFKVSYYPFSGENCSYVDMANIYRDYLFNSNKVALNKTENDVALNLEVIGGAETLHHFLGVPYYGLNTLTTIDEASNIMKNISDSVGKNFSMSLMGFTTNGIDVGKPAGGGNISSQLGGWSDLKKLYKSASELNVNVFTNFDTVKFDASGFGCSTSDATKSVSQKSVVLTYKYKESGNPDTQLSSYRLVGRKNLDTVNNKILKKVSSKKINGVSLNTLTTMAYSDYSDKNYYLASNMGKQVSGIINNYKQANISVLGTYANSYAAVLCDQITDVPLSSSEYDAYKFNVPFYQIVFKGYVPMTSKPVNSLYSNQVGVLKAIESGIGVTYAVVNRYEPDLKYSPQNISYVFTAEELYKELDKDYFKEFNNYFDLVKGAQITGHEIINDKVRITTFDNGVRVCVNYGEAAADVEGKQISGLSFEVLEGGK